MGQVGRSGRWGVRYRTNMRINWQRHLTLGTLRIHIPHKHINTPPQISLFLSHRLTKFLNHYPSSTLLTSPSPHSPRKTLIIQPHILVTLLLAIIFQHPSYSISTSQPHGSRTTAKHSQVSRSVVTRFENCFFDIRSAGEDFVVGCC